MQCKITELKNYVGDGEKVEKKITILIFLKFKCESQHQISEQEVEKAINKSKNDK